MKLKHTHQKTPRLSKKKNQLQNLSTTPSIVPDEEQIATENLFSVSNYQDNINYQKKFNTTFDIFSSVNFHEQYLNGNNPTSNLLKTSRTNHKKMYHPESLEVKKRKRFQKLSSSEKKSVRTDETLPESNSTRSSFIKYKVKSQYEKSSQKRKMPIIFNQLHSNTVFVGRNIKDSSQESLLIEDSLNYFILNLESPNKYANCRRYRLRNSRKDDNDNSSRLLQPNSLFINNKVKACIGKITPQQMKSILWESFLKNPVTEKMRNSNFEPTDLQESLSQSSYIKQKIQERKTSQNTSFLSNNKLLGSDQKTNCSLPKRKLSPRKQGR